MSGNVLRDNAAEYLLPEARAHWRQHSTIAQIAVADFAPIVRIRHTHFSSPYRSAASSRVWKTVSKTTHELLVANVYKVAVSFGGL